MRQANRIVFGSLASGTASMSILDDAIREHLELKRAHGADEAELKKLEDEAFGPPGRPDEIDPFAEAPTEFLMAPESALEAEQDALEPPQEPEGRRVNVADLQEAPPPAEEAAEEAAEPVAEPPATEEEAVEDEAPVEPTAVEHEVIPEPGDIDAGPSTEEREAIADQPTELFDVEAELGEGEPVAETPSPSDEEIAEEELAEPRLAPGGRFDTAPAEEFEDEEDEDFWSDQRLSEELDQALEAPLEPPSEAPLREAPPLADPPSEEHPFEEDSGEHADEQDAGDAYDPDTGHEDVLEDTPEFLEDAPEDDELWFEQRPPKDFDFDD
jgi:hypothetical protein